MAKNGYQIADEIIGKGINLLWIYSKKAIIRLFEKDIDVKKKLWINIFEAYKLSDKYGNYPILSNINNSCNVGEIKKNKKTIDLSHEKYTFITKITFKNIIKHKEQLETHFNRELDITQKSLNSFEISKIDLLKKKQNNLEKILSDLGIEAKLIQKQETKLSTIYKIHVDNYSKLEGIKKELAFKLKTDEKSIMICHQKGIAEIRVKKPTQLIKFNDLYEENEAKINRMELPVIYGLSDKDEVIIEDMKNSLNMIVAGSTGFGKSVFLHSLIITLLKSKSESLLYLFDPKGNELYDYSQNKRVVFTDNKNHMLNYLKGIDKKMRERNDSMKGKAKNIIEWNKTQAEKWPWIIVVVDEIADIIMSDKADDEEKERAESIRNYITKLAQMGRSSGIRLVLCTQKPIKDIIDTMIKANCITRVCFKTSNEMESRIVLDDGRGSALKKPGEMIALLNSDYINIKAPFMDDKEIGSLIKDLL